MEQQQPQAQGPGGQTWTGREPTDEEKAMHDRVYGLAAKLLYSDAFMPKAEQIFENAPTPVAAAATLATALGVKVVDAARKSGNEIPGASLLSAGWAVMQEIQDFAREVVGEELTQEQIEAAFLNAADQLSEAVQGKGGVRVDATPEERQAMLEMAGGEEGIAQMHEKARQAAVGMPEAAPDPAQEKPTGLGARP